MYRLLAPTFGRIKKRDLQYKTNKSDQIRMLMALFRGKHNDFSRDVILLIQFPTQTTGKTLTAEGNFFLNLCSHKVKKDKKKFVKNLIFTST